MKPNSFGRACKQYSCAKEDFADSESAGGGKEKREMKRTGMGLDWRSNGSIDLIILALMDEMLSIGAAGL